jgi:uncharacterized membrane protein
MNQQKKIILGIIVLVSFLYLAYSFSQTIMPEESTCQVDQGFCPHETQLNLITGALPLMLSVALLVGAGIYYLMSSKVELTKQSLKKNTDVLLKFLNADEKKVVNQLIENQGKVIQAEITRLPGMSKVKSHRIVQRLIDRHVIETERLGKTNIIRFTKEIQDGLF